MTSVYNNGRVEAVKSEIAAQTDRSLFFIRKYTIGVKSVSGRGGGSSVRSLSKSSSSKFQGSAVSDCQGFVILGSPT